MDFTELRKRREAIIAEHEAMEKYDPHWKAEAAAKRPITERPIAFLCDDTIVLLDECIDKLIAGATKFLELVGADTDTLQARLASEPAFAQAVNKCSQLVSDPPKSAVLRVPQQTWNALLYGMNEAGQLVVLTDGKVAVPVSLLEMLRSRKP